jgi:hypothetical protein
MRRRLSRKIRKRTSRCWRFVSWLVVGKSRGEFAAFRLHSEELLLLCCSPDRCCYLRVCCYHFHPDEEPLLPSSESCSHLTPLYALLFYSWQLIMKFVSILSRVAITSVGLLTTFAHADEAVSAECSIPFLYLHSSRSPCFLFTAEERRTPWSFPR